MLLFLEMSLEISLFFKSLLSTEIFSEILSAFYKGTFILFVKLDNIVCHRAAGASLHWDEAENGN